MQIFMPYQTSKFPIPALIKISSQLEKEKPLRATHFSRFKIPDVISKSQQVISLHIIELPVNDQILPGRSPNVYVFIEQIIYRQF